MVTANKEAWETFSCMEMEQKIKSAKLQATEDTVNLNLIVTGMNGKEYTFDKVLFATQSYKDSILFVIKDNENVAIVLEDGDDTTWVRESIGGKSCLMDSFLNYTFLGKNIKENPRFSANYME
jgi:hypothetical protein